MNKVIPLLFTLSIAKAPVLAFGEGVCSLFDKNNASQDETVERVGSSDSSVR